jgi:hypothetical protein
VVTSSIDGNQEAFAMATGVDAAAVALAAFGLPVAPFVLDEKHFVGQPSNDIDSMLRLFRDLENALRRLLGLRGAVLCAAG